MSGIDSGLSEIALRGLEAARVLMNRVETTLAASSPASPPVTGTPLAPEPEAPDAAAALADALRATAAAWRGVGTGEQPASTPPLLTAQSGALLSLDVRPGTAGSGDVWLHNPTSVALGPVSLHITPVVRPKGAGVGIEAVAEPSQYPEVPAQGSLSARVTVTVPPDAPADHYRALVQTSGSMAGWVVLEVRVSP